MSTVFLTNCINTNSVPLYNQIINELKDLGYKIYFIEKYLQKKEPQKYAGKDYFIKNYIEKINELDGEFRSWVGRYEIIHETLLPPLKRERNPADIKKEIVTLMENNSENPIEVIRSILKNTYNKSFHNCRLIGAICHDYCFRRFERFLNENFGIIEKHVIQNIISKNVSQPR